MSKLSTYVTRRTKTKRIGKVEQWFITPYSKNSKIVGFHIQRFCLKELLQKGIKSHVEDNSFEYSEIAEPLYNWVANQDGPNGQIYYELIKRLHISKKDVLE